MEQSFAAFYIACFRSFTNQTNGPPLLHLCPKICRGDEAARLKLSVRNTLHKLPQCHRFAIPLSLFPGMRLLNRACVFSEELSKGQCRRTLFRHTIASLQPTQQQVLPSA